MKLEITWLGQGGFILENDNGKMAIDPFCGEAKENTRRLYKPVITAGNVFVDFSISTHAHWDHFDPDTYRNYVIPKAILGPGSCMAALTKSGLETEGISFNAGDHMVISGFKLSALYADHDGDSIGAIIEYDGYRLYFSGDTKFSSLLLARNIDLRPDISFICINGKFLNMDCTEAALYSGFLKTKMVVPTHYDLIENNTEDPSQLLDKLPQLASGVTGFIMDRGKTYKIEQILKQR